MMNLIELVSRLEKAGKEVTSAQEVETNVVSLSFPDEGIVICTDEKEKLIDKACKWLYDNYWSEASQKQFVEDFRNAMEK